MTLNILTKTISTIILGQILGQDMVTDGCPACVTVDHLPGSDPDPDDLAGVYM